MSWHISGVASYNLTFPLKILTFFSIIVLRTFWRTTIICIVYSDLKKLISQKMVFGENRWPRILFWMCGNKKNHWVPRQGKQRMTRRVGRSTRRWFEPMCERSSCRTMIRLLLFVIRISSKKLWCTTQHWPYNVAQVKQSPHDQFWWKSHGMSPDDFALSVHARHLYSLVQRPLFDDLHGFYLWATVGHNWIH